MHHLRAALLAGFLFGCHKPDPGECSALSQVLVFADADGDGYGDDATAQVACSIDAGFTAIGGDCDDGDAANYPGGGERCDAVDNDCDGDVDEGMPLKTYYSDYDGDGVGNATYPVDACQLPVGAALEPGDCDDTNPAILPFATEICDGVDNDCDGRTDDADPSLDASTESEWYADADGDGFGDPLVVSLACADPPKTVANADDCDDTNPDVLPGGTETCNDRDDDCDGLWDETDPDLDPSELHRYYFDGDADGYGDPASFADACTAPLFYVDNDDDCDDLLPLLGLPAPWTEDSDGDGVGAGPPSASQCDPPAAGWVPEAAGVDCGPSDPAVYPGATEICGDSVDQDCDGLDLFCTVGLSDTCDEAQIQPVADSGSWPISADLSSFADDLNVVSGSCLPGGTSGTEGMVEVQLQPGQLLTATSADPTADSSLYLVADCALANTCLGGANNESAVGSTETLQYYNNTAVPLSLYAVYDCVGASCGTQTGEITVATQDYLADTCADAQTWTPFEDGSLTLVATLSGFTNDIALGAGSCTGLTTDGTDGFLPVLVHAGQTLKVTYVQRTADASIYLLTDCSVGNSCIKGVDVGSAGDPETLNWTNTSGGDSLVYVGFDCWHAACNTFTANLSVE